MANQSNNQKNWQEYISSNLTVSVFLTKAEFVHGHCKFLIFTIHVDIGKSNLDDNEIVKEHLRILVITEEPLILNGSLNYRMVSWIQYMWVGILQYRTEFAKLIVTMKLNKDQLLVEVDITPRQKDLVCIEAL